MASVRERVEPIWQQFQSFIGNPKIILPAVGVIAFWAQRNKEFSTGQLIAIGIGVAPWLLRFVKSMELFGQKLDFRTRLLRKRKPHSKIECWTRKLVISG